MLASSFSTRFLLRKNRRSRSLPPLGATCSLPPFSLRSNVAPHIPPGSAGVRSFVPRLAPRSHPGACSHSVAFRSAKPRSRSLPPLSDGGALTKSENIILCASSCHPPRSPYPHCTLPHVRFSGIGQKKKPQRKTAAAVAYHSLFLSFRLCGTRSPACFVIRIHSTSLSSRGENKKGKRARFPFLLCSERLISARSAFSLFFPAPVPDAARLPPYPICRTEKQSV